MIHSFTKYQEPKIIKFLRKRFSSFTLVEVLVALTIISIAVTATVSIFSNALTNMSRDKRLQTAIKESNRYFLELYLADNLKEKLFSTREISNLQYRQKWPLLMKPKEIDLTNGMTMLVNRKIRRWNPLFVDVGLEVLWNNAFTNSVKRHYWVESTFSERYMSEMK